MGAFDVIRSIEWGQTAAKKELSIDTATRGSGSVYHKDKIGET